MVWLSSINARNWGGEHQEFGNFFASRDGAVDVVAWLSLLEGLLLSGEFTEKPGAGVGPMAVGS
jgi:hypothetical protein